MRDAPPSDLNAENDLPPEDKRPVMAPFPIVGVGASAGGLESLSQLLGALPVDTGMAFVLIQHLDPQHKSHLPAILSRATKMNVNEVSNGMMLQANHVYVGPPNKTLRLAERALYLDSRPARTVPQTTVDDFFQSLADAQGRLSIGVVLSGAGSDGSKGIKAIKSAYGLTFAQDEKTAQYASMPHSAIATGAIDFVLPPALIALELARISRHPYLKTAVPSSRENTPDGEGELNQFFSLLLRDTGVDFSHYKKTTLRRRLGRRLMLHGCDSLAAYLTFVHKRPEEVKELYRDLLVHVTSFFRDPEAFASLMKQVAELLQKHQIESSFRAWIPGCSTGEEVYSLAIAVQEVFANAGVRPHFQFFGTDISEQSLDTAREGVYAEHLVRDVSTERLNRHFKKVDGRYEISKSIREKCVFARQDVTRDTPFSHLNLISCRNMLMYLEPVLQKGLMPIFHYGLNPGGLLFLGNSESVGAATDLFAAVDSKHRVFSRNPGRSRLMQSFAQYRNPAEPMAHFQIQESINNLELQKKVDRTIHDRYAPDCVVINDELQILQFRGHTAFYLEPPPGEATYHLLRMVRADLRYAMRETVARAITSNAFIEKKDIRVQHDSATRNITLEVIPLAVAADHQRFFLIVFTQTQLSPALIGTPHSAVSGDAQVSQLEQQLAESRHYQHSLSEDFDAAIGEARAANEELQSANEELQSTNEELETTKEELQSANEELSTVNEELDTRNQQLGVLNDDLTNLFGAVNVPIIRVDRELRLRRFTPAAESLLRLSLRDLDRPIRDLQGRIDASAELLNIVSGVTSLSTVENHQLQDLQGRWWSMTITPYRTADDRLDGAVLTFTDIDSIKISLQASREALMYADSIIETVREPLVMLDSQLQVERANASFYKTFHLTTAETEGKFIYELANRQWNAPALRSLLEEVRQNKESFADFELRHTFPGIGMRVMLLNARRLNVQSKIMILLAFEDVTQRREAEQAFVQRLEKSDLELDRTKEELRALAVGLMSAREEEQRRIARDLHDDLLQRLAFLEFQVERFRTGPVASVNKEMTELLSTVEGELGRLSDTTRNIAHQLHPTILDDLGLVAALRKLAKEVRVGRASAVSFRSRVKPSFGGRGQFAGAVYRIAQEALHNAIKHAPEVPIGVTLSSKANEMRLSITDAGPGFDPVSVRGAGGLGLVNMQERARLLGGSLQIESQPGSGTTITLRVPLPDPNPG